MTPAIPAIPRPTSRTVTPSRRNTCFALLAALCLGLASAFAAAADARLDRFLDDCAGRYSEEQQMVGQKLQGPGYHTTLQPGAMVHPTRQALDYAVALFDRGTPADLERGRKILRKVISLQDPDPASRTYGIWPWFLEEPLAKMSPPDWNWADFCGARLAMILSDHKDLLSPELVEKTRVSLGHAARAIQKRNVGPGYTNIAIMGGGVCAAAGELLGDPKLLEYGRKRLEQMVEHTARHGSFNEYNSPTYTMVALAECERTLHLVRDPDVRKAAESLRRTAWQIIAQSYHPATCQWAGPHSRAYSDYLSPGTAAILAEQTGAPIVPHDKADPAQAVEMPAAWRLPCPEDLKARFRHLPSDPYEIRRTFVLGSTPAASVVGTTWFSGGACLGSVNRGTFWTQCRPLIGYWKTDLDPAVVVRLRFLHDGRDFASMGVTCAQSGGRALAAVYPLRNQGDWHPSLDRPAKGIFLAADLRLRIELAGKGVAIEKLGADRWSLAAGDWRAVVHAPAGRFGAERVVWQSAQGDGRAWLDAICYKGEKRSFDFQNPPEVLLAAGIEMIAARQRPAEALPEIKPSSSGGAEAHWAVPGELNVTAPPIK